MSFCIKLVINRSPCAWYWTFFFTKGVNLPIIRNMIKWPFYILFSNLGHILKIKKGRKSNAICRREASKFIDPICWRFFKVIAFPPLPLLDITNAIIGKALLDSLSTLMNYQGVFMRFSFQWISQSLTASKWSFYKRHPFAWTIFLIF